MYVFVLTCTLRLFVLEKLPCIRPVVKCILSSRLSEVSHMGVQIVDPAKMGSSKACRYPHFGSHV